MKTPLLESVLKEAIEDEYKARATYQAVIDKFGPVRPFINILQAENRHVDALLPLFHKYGIEIPTDNWAIKAKAPESLLDACLAGVHGEIDNGKMYDRLLANSNNYPDVQHVLRNLQRASQQNHLPAFQRAAQRYDLAEPSISQYDKEKHTDSGTDNDSWTMREIFIVGTKQHERRRKKGGRFDSPQGPPGNRGRCSRN